MGKSKMFCGFMILLGVVLLGVGEGMGKSKYNDLSMSLNIQPINSFTEFESKKGDIMKMNPDKKKFDDAQMYAILSIIGLVFLILGFLCLLYCMFLKKMYKNSMLGGNDNNNGFGKHKRMMHPYFRY